jgi:hypothetical protein
VIVDVRAEHFALGGGMLAVGSDVDREIMIMFRIIESVMFLLSVDLRFADRRNLALVCVERGEPFGR